jgi:hypothetical protein
MFDRYLASTDIKTKSRDSPMQNAMAKKFIAWIGAKDYLKGAAVVLSSLRTHSRQSGNWKVGKAGQETPCP